uniref:hypothetical protein n=1 Tax=Accumulibacter sp. TaxID=2053492 RepID=UPI0028C3BF68
LSWWQEPVTPSTAPWWVILAVVGIGGYRVIVWRIARAQGAVGASGWIGRMSMLSSVAVQVG